MRILVCHNFYQQPGGEDQVFAAEVDLLRLFGHEVTTFKMDNDAVNAMSKTALAMRISNVPINVTGPSSFGDVLMLKRDGVCICNSRAPSASGG